MRLLAAVLVVAALLWWLFQSDDHARRDRTGQRARGEAERSATRDGEDGDAAASRAADPEQGTATDSAGSDDAAPGPATVVRGRVQVLGRNDVPVEGVQFTSEPALLQFARATDRMGWTDWEAKKEYAGIVIIDSLLARKHRVEIPVTTIRFPDLVPLEVEFLDALTGAILGDGAVTLPPGRGKTIHGRTPRTILVAPIEAGRRCDFMLHLEPPKGTTGDFGLAEEVRCRVSKRAHAAHLRIPLWPEMQLMLEFRDENGLPKAGVRLDAVFLLGRRLRVLSGASDANGRLEVKGVPYRGRLRTRLSIHADGFEYRVWIRRKAQHVSLVRGQRIRDVDSSTPKPAEPDGEVEEAGAALDVEVRWLDRDPALDVPVVLAREEKVFRARRTDSGTGVASFDQLPLGDLRVAVLDAALAFEERVVSLRDDRRTPITIGPAQGRKVIFVVQRGEPMSGARLSASSWFGEVAPPLYQGVQELSAVTGAKGVLTWHGFPVSAIRVVARRADWRGDQEVPEGIRSARRPIPLTMRIR